MRDTITRVHDNTSGTAGGIKREDSLDVDIHGGGVEGLKHNLSHLFPVSLGVEGSFSQEDGVLFRSNTKLIVEGMMPDLLHVIPVGHNSVLNGVFQGEDTPLRLGLVSSMGTYSVPWVSNNGWEHSLGFIITSKPGLAHTGAIVNDNSSYFVVTHVVFLWVIM